MYSRILVAAAVAGLAMSPVVASAQAVLGFGSIASTASQSAAGSQSTSALFGVTGGSASAHSDGTAVAVATPAFGFAAQATNTNAASNSGSLGLAGTTSAGAAGSGAAALAFGGFGIVIP